MNIVRVDTNFLSGLLNQSARDKNGFSCGLIELRINIIVLYVERQGYEKAYLNIANNLSFIPGDLLQALTTLMKSETQIPDCIAQFLAEHLNYSVMSPRFERI